MPDLELGPEDYKATNPDPKEPVFTSHAHIILAVLFMLGMFGWLASQSVAPIIKAVIERSLVALGVPETVEQPRSRLLLHQQLSGCPQRYAGAASSSAGSGLEASRRCVQ